MKSLTYILAIFFLLLTQTAIPQIEAILSHKKFYTTTQPYIESYIEIPATSIKFTKNKAGGVYYNIEVQQNLWKDTTLIHTLQYLIKTEDTSTNKVLENIIDQRRFYVKNNSTYKLEINIKDLLGKSQFTKATNILVSFPIDTISFSDIELLEYYSKTDKQTPISKSGFNLYPLVDEFYSNDIIRLSYYVEIYNTNLLADTSGYVLLQYIEDYSTHKKIGDFNRIKRYPPTTIQPILNSWNIEQLPTGNYNLVLQLRNRNNEIISEKKKRIQRLNFKNVVRVETLNKNVYAGTFVESIPKDSLNEQIKMLQPIADELEQITITQHLPTLDEQMKRAFIYTFWKNHNPDNPEKEWRLYKRKIRYVHSQFATNKRKGYETDRGRIYLKYGMPNSINSNPSSDSMYPYQVWHYYRAGKYNNKTCIFYSPNSLVDDYILLHSDIPGEAKDINWQRTIKKQNNSPTQLQHQNWFQY